MTMYRTEPTPAVAREVRKLNHPVHVRLLDTIRSFTHSLRSNRAKKLTSTENTWRIRVGDYQIIYSIEDGVFVMIIVRVTYRREIYRL